jgi:transcriptional regulator with GAF, ATPase, and Fis domain
VRERALILLLTGATLLVEPVLDAVEPYLALAPNHTVGTSHSDGPLPTDAATTPGTVDAFMRGRILNVVQKCHWRIKGENAAAARLGLNPGTRRYRMKKPGLDRRVTR